MITKLAKSPTLISMILIPGTCLVSLWTVSNLCLHSCFNFANLNLLNHQLCPERSWINSNDRERYYFSPLSAKNPGSNSKQVNRSTKTGSWKVTGEDKIILDELTGEKIGIMKIYVHSRKENGIKWVMHEFKSTLNLPDEVFVTLLVSGISFQSNTLFHQGSNI